MEPNPDASAPPTARLTEDEARTTFAAECGARVIGGIYHSAYWETDYRVVGIHYGPAALTALGWDAGWAITIQDHHGVRTKSDLWDSTEDNDTETAVPSAGAYHVAHGAFPLGHYSNLDAARTHITALLAHESREHRPGPVVWIADLFDDPDSPLEAHLLGCHDQPAPTGYVITPLLVADHYDPTADE
ncbi:hypothetical protein EYS09_07955 [Streptomyces kasugaensis]|uniref:Uncharacterized protein n=1 Tax=Streptomyces kasugaensis TaxID=1946 RepID=A0A4Q9HYA7_STRKA|nr:hypothetical protein [Streptomyces kasugaensis]TBO60222.1 hypothetical protein EYS09_07955 [Streptomyces kasugaensis]